MAIDEKYRDAVSYLEQVIPIIGKMGVRIEEYGKGKVKVLLPLEPNKNHVGILYAGSLFSLADYTGGVLAFSLFDFNKYYPLIKEANVKYKKPATSDVTIEASVAPEDAERIRKTADETGKSDWLLNMELKDSQGDVCTIVNGVFQIRKR